MERDWLAARLDAGDSIEAIAREVARDPSTVAYWVNKHGLRSPHAARHARRGGLTREQLEPLVERGLTIRQIAEELDRSSATVRHWLKRHGLKTQVAQRVRRDGSTAPEVIRDCPRHGWTWFRRLGAQTHYRCAQCVIDAVVDARRRVRTILIDEAGGRCLLAAMTATRRLFSSTTSTARPRSSRCAMGTLARLSGCARRPRSVCCSAPIATPRSSPARRSFPYHHVKGHPPG